MKNRNGWHLFLRNELDFYTNRGIIGKRNADVAERQTRWFQVPVLRDVWVQIPSSAPKIRNVHSGIPYFSFLRKRAPIIPDGCPFFTLFYTAASTINSIEVM